MLFVQQELQELRWVKPGGIHPQLQASVLLPPAQKPQTGTRTLARGVLRRMDRSFTYGPVTYLPEKMPARRRFAPPSPPPTNAGGVGGGKTGGAATQGKGRYGSRGRSRGPRGRSRGPRGPYKCRRCGQFKKGHTCPGPAPRPRRPAPEGPHMPTGVSARPGPASAAKASMPRLEYVFKSLGWCASQVNNYGPASSLMGEHRSFPPKLAR